MSNVSGMNLKEDPNKSINGKHFKIKVLAQNKLKIVDYPDIYTHYVTNGIIKQVKLPQVINFKPYFEEKYLIDPMLQCYDFMKLDHPLFTHIAYKTLSHFYNKYKTHPQSWNLEDCEEFL